jgi:hypothetical protein
MKAVVTRQTPGIVTILTNNELRCKYLLLTFGNISDIHVGHVPCHFGMARPRVADGVSTARCGGKNQVELNLHEAHQLLDYTDILNLLEYYISTLRKSLEI